MHFFPITGTCLCAVSGQSLRVQFDHALCFGTSLLELEDPLVMLLCFNTLDNVARNHLVLVLLKSVPWLMIYDVICVEISMAKIFARILLHLKQIVPILMLYYGRRGGLMVSALDSGSDGPGFSPGQGTALCSWA